jgi:hypothetical protein
MDPAVTRFATGLLVLMVCAFAAWLGPDRTPSRTVTELVSVVHFWPRAEVKAAGELARAEPTAPAPETNSIRRASPKRLAEGRAPSFVTRAHVHRAKDSCRSPTCRQAALARNAVRKQVAARQAPKAEPQLPAVFVPIRNLGLYLQARLAALGVEKAAPAKRKAGRKRK